MENIVERIAKRLREEKEAREMALDLSRRARVLSKTVILLIHSGDMNSAEAKLQEARRMLEASAAIRKARRLQIDELGSAEEEYAEAEILLSLKRREEIPPPESLNVEPARYLLGLADVIGELRREAVDALRVGELGEAERMLERMEQIYLTLTSADEAMILLKGLRRKLDVARSLIESTRGQIAEEKGRRRLIKTLERFKE